MRAGKAHCLRAVRSNFKPFDDLTITEVVKGSKHILAHNYRAVNLFMTLST